MAKITLQELIEKAENKTPQVEVFQSEELGGEIEFVKQSGWSVMKVVEGIEGSITRGMRANCIIILDHCPLFQDATLQKKLAVGEPWEVVPKVFNQNIGEIAKLAQAILAMYNMGDEAEELKN